MVGNNGNVTLNVSEVVGGNRNSNYHWTGAEGRLAYRHASRYGYRMRRPKCQHTYLAGDGILRQSSANNAGAAQDAQVNSRKGACNAKVRALHVPR